MWKHVDNGHCTALTNALKKVGLVSTESLPGMRYNILLSETMSCVSYLVSETEKTFGALPRYVESLWAESMEHKPNGERISRTHVWSEVKYSITDNLRLFPFPYNLEEAQSLIFRKMFFIFSCMNLYF